METVKLAEVTRGSLVESIHRGAVAVVDTKGKLLASAGNPQYLTYFRSAGNRYRLYLCLKVVLLSILVLTYKSLPF